MKPDWLAIIYGIGVLILVAPLMLYMVRQPGALRNFAIWVAILAALAWGYHIVVEVPQQQPPGSASPSESAPNQNQSPVRNL